LNSTHSIAGRPFRIATPWQPPHFLGLLRAPISQARNAASFRETLAFVLVFVVVDHSVEDGIITQTRDLHPRRQCGTELHGEWQLDIDTDTG
jgi:hypothetical protein